MFSKIYQLGSWFSFEVQVVKHDVEKIIADFTATVTKLEAAAEAKLEEARVFTQKSIDFEAIADEAHKAAEKAAKVAGQIKALVS